MHRRRRQILSKSPVVVARDSARASERKVSRRLVRLEGELQALHAVLEAQAKRLAALQAQIDHFTAKFSSRA